MSVITSPHTNGLGFTFEVLSSNVLSMVLRHCCLMSSVDVFHILLTHATASNRSCIIKIRRLQSSVKLSILFSSLAATVWLTLV